ncbi:MULTISPECIES: hypothetical protein [Streptomyces]|uniref:hypothetical protein n=1 Tax=Streptomyces TaxID=1883 RepID=UPI0004AB9E76|nr:MULTISPECIES: hypothetical protein [Streptomyces]
MSEQEQNEQEQNEQGPGEQGPEQDRAPQEKPGAKARLVFRDPLDQQSRDDTDAGWGDGPGAGSGRGLDWYLSQRPPHHGG